MHIWNILRFLKTYFHRVWQWDLDTVWFVYRGSFKASALYKSCIWLVVKSTPYANRAIWLGHMWNVVSLLTLPCLTARAKACCSVWEGLFITSYTHTVQINNEILTFNAETLEEPQAAPVELTWISISKAIGWFSHTAGHSWPSLMSFWVCFPSCIYLPWGVWGVMTCQTARSVNVCCLKRVWSEASLFFLCVFFIYCRNIVFS